MFVSSAQGAMQDVLRVLCISVSLAVRLDRGFSLYNDSNDACSVPESFFSPVQRSAGRERCKKKSTAEERMRVHGWSPTMELAAPAGARERKRPEHRSQLSDLMAQHVLLVEVATHEDCERRENLN